MSLFLAEHPKFSVNIQKFNSVRYIDYKSCLQKNSDFDFEMSVFFSISGQIISLFYKPFCKIDYLYKDVCCIMTNCLACHTLTGTYSTPLSQYFISSGVDPDPTPSCTHSGKSKKIILVSFKAETSSLFDLSR